MYVYVSQGYFPTIRNRITGSVQNAARTYGSTWYGAPSQNAWVNVQGPVNADNTDMRYLSIGVAFTTDPDNPGFAGTIYVDDIQLTPP